MEYWSFPPDYDPGYVPEPESRYWFPKRETMSADAREPAIAERLREVMRYAYETTPFYRRKWDEAGVHPEHIRSLDDFERVPVVTKQELRASQARAPPFGDYLAVPESEVHHVHGTSGTTGRPTAFAIGRQDWATIAENHARVMWGMGVRPGATVFIAAIFSLVSAIAGAPGMTARAATWLAMMTPTAFYGTPSYALYLAGVAQDEGIDPRRFGLKMMFFSGEPGASIPGIRERIEEIYGATVIDCGSMAEMTPWMNAAGSLESRHDAFVARHRLCRSMRPADLPARALW